MVMERDLIETMLDWIHSHHFGKYRGIVTDNADPNQRGRLKVRVPAVLGDGDVGDAVRPVRRRPGRLLLPAGAGTGVWVEFEGGDPSFPIWTGFFWADGRSPDDGQPARKVLRTEQRHLAHRRRGRRGAPAPTPPERSSSWATTASSTTRGPRSRWARPASSRSTRGAKLEVANAAVSANGGALEVR